MTSGPTSDDAPPPGTTGPAIRWRRSVDALWRVVPGGLVALALDGEARPQLITGPAVETWDLLEDPHTVVDLIALLAQRYGVDPDDVADDVAGLIADLADHGLVTADSPAGDEASAATTPHRAGEL